MKKRVIYLGNFGKNQKLIDSSQTKKTKSIAEYLILNNLKVVRINTANFKNFFGFITLIKYILMVVFMPNATVVISLNKNGLRFFNGLLIKISLLYKNRKIIFITIGGWLPEFSVENKKLMYKLHKMNKIYVQTQGIKNKLLDLGYSNIEVMYNFIRLKNLGNNATMNYLNKEENGVKILNLVFFSFVKKEKGIEIACNAIYKFNLSNKKFKIKLDVYGPIDEEYQSEFLDLVNSNKNVNYKGSIKKQEEIINTLKKYEYMIFPTYYEGEGFPTVIVESMTAGLPVIASNWKYNSEIIVEGYNGYLFEQKNIDDLLRVFMYIFENLKQVRIQKNNCISESERFKIDKILEPILNYIKA